MTKAAGDLWEKKSDWLVWIAGAICFLLLFTFSLKNNNNSDQKSAMLNYGTDNIDELMLSSDELVFADKKSFVKGTLRFQWTNDSVFSFENSRKNLYNYIYQKKLKKAGKKPGGNQDFSIRPVPQ
jgi:hypothetical protein